MRLKKSRKSAFSGLLWWSLLRHKFYIPVFVIVQLILSMAIIYGFSFITNASNELERSFLCTGATTMNIVAVTCVLSPQIVSESKQSGVLDYQQTLPINRVGILLSDLIIWGGVALPGILVCLVIGAMSFHLDIFTGILEILSLLFVITSLIFLGFAIAYLFPANMMTLMTQLIMMGGLLFSPIIYPADRLPRWMGAFYNFLPFVPVSEIIRSSLFHLTPFNLRNYFIVFIWGCIGFLVSLYVITKRK
ncbi:MAG: ABC transporter permease [Aerococcus sp.]|nr:ABC transporter permease [Aerococcus sp.]